MIKKKKMLFSNPGSKTVPRYVRQVNDKGMYIMVINDTFNLYDDIQTYKDDNDIYKILARVSGDVSKLDFNKGVYIDVSKIPDNINDYHNMSYRLQSDFTSLPVKYKEALGSNFNIFYALAMNGQLDDFVKFVDNNDVKKVQKVVQNVSFDYKKPLGEEIKNDNKVKENDSNA